MVVSQGWLGCGGSRDLLLFLKQKLLFWRQVGVENAGKLPLTLGNIQEMDMEWLTKQGQS